MTSYAYLIAPPGAGTTLQGIFGALFEGIGILFAIIFCLWEIKK